MTEPRATASSGMPARSPVARSPLRRNGPTSVYRLFDAEGMLLYVGLSLNVAQRLGQHHLAPWWHEVAHVEIERFDTRDEASQRERACIQATQPMYNRNGLKVTARKSGRKGHPMRYGVKTIQRPVYYPPVLLRRLQEEAAWRGARAGNPDKSKVSDLVVEILAAHFGIDLPVQESGNGR